MVIAVRAGTYGALARLSALDHIGDEPRRGVGEAWLQRVVKVELRTHSLRRGV